MGPVETLGLALGAGFSSGLNLDATIATLGLPQRFGIIAYTASGGAPPEWRWGAALLAGGVGLTSHGTKAATRAAANTSPEPFSNWALSFGEDPIDSE